MSSARVALQLRRAGVARVRPLAGGFAAWAAAGHPVVAIEPDAAPLQAGFR